MFQIHTKLILTEFSGDPIKEMGTPNDLTVWTAISKILIAHDNDDRLKMYCLAQSFWQDEWVIVDAADKELIKLAIKKTRVYNNIIAGQILSCFDAITVDQNSKPKPQPLQVEVPAPVVPVPVAEETPAPVAA